MRLSSSVLTIMTVLCTSSSLLYAAPPCICLQEVLWQEEGYNVYWAYSIESGIDCNDYSLEGVIWYGENSNPIPQATCDTTNNGLCDACESLGGVSLRSARDAQDKDKATNEWDINKPFPATYRVLDNFYIEVKDRAGSAKHYRCYIIERPNQENGGRVVCVGKQDVLPTDTIPMKIPQEHVKNLRTVNYDSNRPGPSIFQVSAKGLTFFVHK